MTSLDIESKQTMATAKTNPNLCLRHPRQPNSITTITNGSNKNSSHHVRLQRWLGANSLISMEDGKKYWEGIEADVNGMLGGIPSVTRIDLQGSRTFLARLGIGIKTGRKMVLGRLRAEQGGCIPRRGLSVSAKSGRDFSSWSC